MKRAKIVYEEIDFKEFASLVNELAEEEIEKLQDLYRNLCMKGYRGVERSVIMYCLGKSEGERKAAASDKMPKEDNWKIRVTIGNNKPITVSSETKAEAQKKLAEEMKQKLQEKNAPLSAQR